MNTSMIGELANPIFNTLTSTALTTSAAIDRTNFRSAILGISIGKVTGVPDSYTAVAKILHCATSTGTFAQYTSQETGAALATVSAIDTNAYVNVDLNGAAKFIQIIGSNTFVGGSSPTAFVQPFVILGGATSLPV